jgi:transcriptional regulator with XRE-family HTH domain
MARIKIGRTVRRLRIERNLSQQALANRLGISASYLNLIEHDQRAVSGSLVIKLAETLHLDLAALSGPWSASSRSGCARCLPTRC